MLDVVELLRGYMHAALAAVPGYKALVLDSETMRMYATLFGRTELAEKDVVHVERLDAPAPGPARPGAGAGAGTGKKMEHMELKARGPVHQLCCCIACGLPRCRCCCSCAAAGGHAPPPHARQHQPAEEGVEGATLPVEPHL